MAGAIPYRAVTFDFWNTLVVETTEPVETRQRLWIETLADAGHELTEERLGEAFKHSWGRFDERWKANEQSTAELMARDAIAHLDVDLAPAVADRLVEAYLEASLLTPRVLVDGVEETFDRLRGLGLGVGIISDIGAVPSSQIRRWLDEMGVHHLVTHFSFSDEVGVFKPHERIFEHALDGLDVGDAGSAAHVGDLRRTDVAGANAAGMTSVQYVGGREDPHDGDPESATPDHVIADHLELLHVLGLVELGHREPQDDLVFVHLAVELRHVYTEEVLVADDRERVLVRVVLDRARRVVHSHMDHLTASLKSEFFQHRYCTPNPA